MRTMKRNICRLVLLGMLFFTCMMGMADTADAKTGTWKQTKKGWWYSYSDGSYAKNEWVKYSGKWYYFGSNGYMETEAYRDGYWLAKNGAASMKNSGGTWKKSGKKWWFTDKTGWYPKNQWLRINGKYYYFYKSGYVAINQWIGNDYVGADGAWVGDNLPKNSKKTVNPDSLPGDELRIMLDSFGCRSSKDYNAKNATVADCVDILGSRYFCWCAPVYRTWYEGGDDWDIQKDPLKKLEDSGRVGYYSVSEADVKWLLTTVMNISDSQVNQFMKDTGVKNAGPVQYYHYKKNYYYCDSYVHAGDPPEFHFDSVKTDGVYYYIDYSYICTDEYKEAYGDNVEDEYYRAVLSYKYEYGMYFWSIHKAERIK